MQCVALPGLVSDCQFVRPQSSWDKEIKMLCTGPDDSHFKLFGRACVTSNSYVRCNFGIGIWCIERERPHYWTAGIRVVPSLSFNSFPRVRFPLSLLSASSKCKMNFASKKKNTHTNELVIDEKLILYVLFIQLSSLFLYKKIM